MQTKNLLNKSFVQLRTAYIGVDDTATSSTSCGLAFSPLALQSSQLHTKTENMILLGFLKSPQGGIVQSEFVHQTNSKTVVITQHTFGKRWLYAAKTQTIPGCIPSLT